ncbi:MAG: hypothetical protein AMXMBFR20_32950 [Planctomycetia bacterium]
MKTSRDSQHVDTEADDIAKQFHVEIALLVNIEKAIRFTLDWDSGNHETVRKLSTLRFATQTFERHLARVRALSEHGGYMHLITDKKPRLANEVMELKSVRDELQDQFERLIVALEHLSAGNPARLEEICSDYRSFLEALDLHGQNERELFHRACFEELGGSG